LFSIKEQTLTGDHLQFQISALGQAASGSIDVADDCVRLEVFLPWLLTMLAETAHSDEVGRQFRAKAAARTD
jgi:hypothetical protein